MDAVSRSETAVAETRLQLALSAGRLGTWSYNLQTGEQVWDAQQYALFGLSQEQQPTRELFERGQDVFVSGDRRCRGQPCRAMPHVAAEGRTKGVCRAIHEVAAVAAMHVQVDEARREVAVPGLDQGNFRWQIRGWREDFGDPLIAN